MNTPITRVGGQGLAPLKQLVEDKVSKDGQTFSATLEKFVNDVNSLQLKMDESIEKMATGEIEDIHKAMIAVEEANTAMEFMLEIRNKIVEAYQEIMRMPV
ncbi:MAG: flagellar hook-basal body complex protein FliE [Candidatus Latescibacteria bacterium]|nr:flagellar hook-basal body complex protein FliE [Candidatus Latescibacterota bacterium]